jgi:hypothetical protein
MRQYAIQALAGLRPSYYVTIMAQHSDLLTGTLTLKPPARGHTAWSVQTDEGPVGRVAPPRRGPGLVELHGLVFDLSYGQFDDGGPALLRPWRLTLEGPNLFHAWSVPRQTLLTRLIGHDHVLFMLEEHRPPLRMETRGGLNRQIALRAGDDLLALADHPRGRRPCDIRHAPTLPPAILAALCHAVTQPA